MPKYIVTSDVPAFLADKGYKVSPTYFKRIATPGQGKGPQPAGFWGNRKIYDPEELLRWAHGRIRPTRQEIGCLERPDRDNWKTLGVAARKVLARSARGTP